MPQNELVLTNGAYETSIDNLRPYSQYLITIRACNKDLVTSEYYCLNGKLSVYNKSVIGLLKVYSSFNQLTGTGIMDTNFKSVVYKENFLSFFTSQDRPEDQPTPTIRTVNSTFIILAISKPLKPNGIVLIYQIWLRKLNEDSLKIDLVCSIEEFYDPNEGKVINNAPKICLANNLAPNTAYEVSASSSTIIGSSILSPSLILTTLEESPRCPVEIVTAYSNAPSSVLLQWSPSVNTSKTDSYWQKCTIGNIKAFKVYKKRDMDTAFNISYQGKI